MRFSKMRIQNGEQVVFDSNNGNWIEVRKLCESDQEICQDLSVEANVAVKKLEEKVYTRRRSVMKEKGVEENKELEEKRPDSEKVINLDFQRRKDALKEEAEKPLAETGKPCPKCGKLFKRGLTMHLRFCKGKDE